MRKKLIIFAISSFFQINISFAADWQEVDIFGGNGECLAISQSNPSILYMGVSGRRIYKTIDAAVNWTQSEDIFNGDANPKAIIIHPTDPNKVLMGSDAVYKTADGGATWENKAEESFKECVELAASTSNINVVYAAFADSMGRSAKIYRSADFGDSWIYVGAPSVGEAFQINSLSIDNDGVVFAGYTDDSNDNAGPGSLYYSTDNGGTWALVANSNPTGLGSAGIWDIICDEDNNYLYLATVSSGVWKSTITAPAGRSWYKITEKNMFALTVDPTDSTVIYGAKNSDQLQDNFNIYKDTVSGENGFDAAITSPEQGLRESFSEIIVDPTNSSILYLLESREDCLYKSTNSGNNWYRSINGVRAATVQDGEKDLNTGRIYISCSEYLHYSDDDGTTWSKMFRPVHGAGTIVLHPNDSSLILLRGSGELFRSTNTGTTFNKVDSYVNHANNYAPGRDVVFKHDDPDILFLGKMVSANETEYEGNYFYTSDDSGATWRPLETLTTKSIRAVAIHPTNSSKIFISACDLASDTHMASGESGGIYVTEDSGESWRHIPLKDKDGNPMAAYQIVIDTANPDTMYMSTYNQENTGESWQLWQSGDGGETWNRNEAEDFSTSRSYGKHIIDIKYKYPSVFITDGNAILASDDQGATWHHLRDVQSLYCIFTGSIYASDAEGLYRLDYVPGSVVQTTLDSVFAFPNPYKPESGGEQDNSALGTGIVFYNLTENADIRIFDIAGQIVCELSEEDGDGKYLWDTLNDDGNTVSSGIYIYQIINPDETSDTAIGRFGIIR